MCPQRRIVLTGGPGGGKTSFLAIASELLRTKSIVLVRESAGFEKHLAGGRSDAIEFQRRVLERQLRAEQEIFRQETKVDGTTILLDRGAFDGVGFLGFEAFERLLDEFGLTLAGVMRRYDHVVFLRSAVPSGATAHERFRVPTADDFVTHLQNMEALLMSAVANHPGLAVVEATADPHKKLLDTAAAIMVTRQR